MSTRKICSNESSHDPDLIIFIPQITMSLSSVFVKVDWELTFQWYIPKPCYHPQNQNVIIVSTDYYEGNQKGIYEYNLTQNTFNKIYTYKQTSRPAAHGQF
eukprot:485565_1